MQFPYLGQMSDEEIEEFWQRHHVHLVRQAKPDAWSKYCIGEILAGLIAVCALVAMYEVWIA